MKHVMNKTERDKAVIQAVVRNFGPISRVGVHELTHLRRTTISQLVGELLKEGKLVADGHADNPLGRKQIRLRLNEEWGFVVGVDFDPDFVVAAVMDLRPRIRTAVKEVTDLEGGVDGLVRQLVSCTRQAIKQSGAEAARLIGIGIGDPGLVNSQEGVTVMSSQIGFWKQVPLKRIFEDEFGVPCLLGDNTRTKTLAERVLGAGEMAEDMIYIEYGRGIGAGIVVRGKILEGHRRSSGEFGHTHVIENGPACTCGSFGCLEAIAGASALEARVRKAIQEGAGSRVMELVDGDPNKITPWAALKAASIGDKTCGMIVEEIGKYLGLGVANLVNLFNPQLIVLDQRLELGGPGLLEQIVRIVKRQALTYATDDLTFRLGRLGTEAAIQGAGLLVVEKLFEIPALRPPRFMVEPHLARKVVTSGQKERWKDRNATSLSI
jgi:predicted NBD/HSP70 family sugar kinase